MQDKIHLKVISHESIVYEDNIDELFVEAHDGRLEILKNHIPVICSLNIGVTKAVKDNKSQCIATMGGILQFSDNKATILTDCAELDCNIDLTRARQAKERAEIRLKEKSEDIDVPRAQLALARAIARISSTNNRV